MKKSELKALKLKINPEFLRKWGEFFYCDRQHQFIMLSCCHHRAMVGSEIIDYLACCKKCQIRIHSFHVVRRPRLIVRTPRRS